MEGSPRAHGMYYRCPARTLAPGSPVLAEHPPAVYLREDLLRESVNGWLGGLFAPGQIDQTVAALVEYQESDGAFSASLEAAKTRLADAEARLRRFQDAIGAGVDPAALTDVINTAQAERAAARAELENKPTTSGAISAAEVYARIDSLGDVRSALSSSKPERLASLYESVDLQVRYELGERAAEIKIHPANRVNSVRVRGGSCALTTRIQLPEAG